MERTIDPQTNPADLADRLEKAEAILDILGHHEADAILSHDGLTYLRAKDVHEREQQYALALRRSQQRLRMATESARLNFFEWDIQRNEVRHEIWADPVPGPSAGHPADTIEAIREAVHADDRDRFTANISAALERPDGIYQNQFRSVQPDGRIVWLQENGLVERDANGQPLRLLGVSQEITDFQEANLALRQSEARLRQAAKAAHFGMFDADLVAGTTYWSPETREILGLSADFIAPPPHVLPDFIHPDDVGPLQAMCTRAFDPAGDGRIDDAYRILRAGAVRWIHLQGRVEFAGQGTRRRAVCLRGVLRDVTESRETQEALRQAKEAADVATQAKSAFLANMSHEIRTPLTVIIGLCHLLRRDLTHPLQRQKVDQLCASSDHLLSIINDVLDLSKIQSERLALDRTDFDLDMVIVQTMRMVDGLAARKGLTLMADVTKPLRDLRLQGDPLRLAQVLINLCSNAVKFTDQGAVRLHITSLAEHADEVTLRFAVEDTGQGIAPADQAQLFQPFTQVASSTARDDGGTGLGLAISQRLVQLMGGTIGVISQLGAGSTFSFELVLPRATSSGQSAAAAPPVQPTTFYGKHVLFAEDHPQTQEILLEMLEDLGCEVDLAADGAEALDCARAHAYDLILIDIQMPKMDGLAAARAIRALPRGCETPIIALTANAFADDRQRCLEAGMNGHLGKPVTPDALAAVLGQWLPEIVRASDETPICDNELSRALATIPDLRVGNAWRSSPEKLLNYGTQLNRFVALHAEDMLQLRAHLQAGRRTEAIGVAHNLVGIASLIGAHHVASLASEIVQALREAGDTSTLEQLVAACAVELARLREQIGRLQALFEAAASP
ncbi:MAG: ATP-binding protein [Candidatus Accumulibacter sp. UW26]|jgi:two-component system sensor histidine kinase/response regulator